MPTDGNCLQKKHLTPLRGTAYNQLGWDNGGFWLNRSFFNRVDQNFSRFFAYLHCRLVNGCESGLNEARYFIV